jgi:hypothetical protein
VNRKVIYVSVSRLTDKIARDWYIDHLIEKGLSVEYWDIVSIVREEHTERGARNPDYLHVFRNFREFERMVREPENRAALFVMLITYCGQVARIFRLLSKYNCRMLFIAWGAMPHDPVSKWRRIAPALANPAWYAKEIFHRSKAIALRGLKLVKPFDIIFAAGEALTAGAQYAAKVVPINLCDYDQYMKMRTQNGRIINRRYSVFLDINLPYQSDLAFCGYPQIDPVGYYRSLNRFFGLLEREHGSMVVVAAHPKADYDGAIFEGRPIHRLVTAELVRDAEFVLSHTSTAQSYAVLNAKPLIFIYTDGMAAAYRDTVIREMHCYARYLDSPIWNVDEVVDGAQVTIAAVNQQRYEKYKYEFLTTHESEQTSTGEVFLREINILDAAETNALR